MKEVMAIIRINRMNETKRALIAAGFSSMTATGQVLGRGKGLVDHRVLKAADEGSEYARALLGQGPRLMSKRILVMTVDDDAVDLAVRTIMDANRTGQAGDGKIFVTACSEVYRIRTGEKGPSALQ